MKGLRFSTVCLGLVMALVIGTLAPHVGNMLPGDNNAFARHDAVPTPPPLVQPAVKVDFTEAYEVSPAQFEQEHRWKPLLEWPKPSDEALPDQPNYETLIWRQQRLYS